MLVEDEAAMVFDWRKWGARFEAKGHSVDLMLGKETAKD